MGAEKAGNMAELLLSIISGLVLSGLGAISVRAIQLVKRQRRLGHLSRLVENIEIVQIVIPSFEVGDFLPKGTGERAAIPRNVRVMLMPEASSIADLVAAFYEAGASKVELVPQENYRDVGLTISVGGPSVNSTSGNLLKRSFPQFHIKYPEHIASYGSTSFSTQTNADNELIEDYGFIASATNSTGNRWFVLCGVWAFGTLIATTTLTRMPRRSPIRRVLRANRPFFAVVHGRVDGFVAEDLKVVELRDVD